MKRQDLTLRLEREGSFAYNPSASDAGRCGTPKNLVLHYRVLLEVASDGLDRNGFIIDNNLVHDYFRHYESETRFWSCEEIAMRACEHFAYRLHRPTKIEVSISGNPNAAWLTSCWQAKSERKKRSVQKEKSYSTLAWPEAANF